MNIYSSSVRRMLLITASSLALTAWTAHADQLLASINGTAQNKGGSIFQYNHSGTQSTFKTNIDRPRGMAFDNQNNLVLATNHLNDNTGVYKGTIVKIAPGGNVTIFANGFAANAPGNGPDFFLEGLVTDSSGNVFVAAQDENDPNFATTIFLITPGGTISTFGSIPGESFGLAFDGAGNLYVPDYVFQTIYQFTPAGVRTVFADSSHFTSVQNPIGLGFDKFGNLFVSTGGNNGDDFILKFAPDATVSTFAMGLAQLPRGLTVANNGDVFVAETGFNTSGDILEITPQGTITVFASGLGRTTGNGGAEYLVFR